MDASPTERQSTGTVSLLDDGPQRSTSVFSSLSFSLFFVIHIFIRVDSTTQHFSTALSADSGSVGRHDYSSESSAKKVTVYAELINKVYQLPSVKRKEKRTEHRSLRNARQRRGVSAERTCPTRTCCDLQDKYDEKQSRAEPSRPISA